MRWLGGASGPKPGARFVGWNRKGLLRWPTTSTIAEYEPEQTISWDVDVVGQSVARWSFTLEPEGQGTRIVQRWQDKRTSDRRRWSARAAPATARRTTARACSAPSQTLKRRVEG